MSNSTPDAETSVYRYYDKAGILIYAGITRQGVNRNLQHNSDKEWWPFVHSQGVDHLPSRTRAHAHEVSLIERFRPPFNVQHNPDNRAIKAAYMAFLRSGAMDSNPEQILQLTRRSIPLDVYSFDAVAGRVEFRTRFEHAAVALRLRHVPERFVFGEWSARWCDWLHREGWAALGRLPESSFRIFGAAQ